MRFLLVFFTALVVSMASLSAQEYYAAGSSTFPVDTITHTKNDTLTFPAGENSVIRDFWLITQFKLTNLADTATVSIITQQSLNNSDWVNTDTLVNGATSIGGNVLGYMGSHFKKARYIRWLVNSTGTSSQVRVQLWAERVRIPYLTSIP